MCGIAGMLQLVPGAAADGQLLRRMCDVMRHRGPDGEGYYLDGAVGLGHRRLSIIDLATGQQPMANEDQSLWIVFNGEIYNYVELGQELRARGHHFRSRSDTEVVLHLYEEKGPQCLDSLRGMFAFALWDGRQRKLFLARDRLGIKPLYYFTGQGRFLFASEIKGILEDRAVPRQSDFNAICQYLRYMYTIDDSTFFAGIKKLLPGHYMVVENGDSLTRQYWDLSFPMEEEHPESYYVQGLYDLLHDSVKIHLRSDVPVGSHLSGGLDSSSLVALASSMLPHPLKTFSGAFAEGGVYDERKYINIVVAKFQTDHYETVPTAQEFADALPKLVWHMDEPTTGSAVICHYYLCKLVGEHVKVVLAGHGADELLGGYFRYLPAYLASCWRRLLLGKMSLLEIEQTAANLVGHVSRVGLRRIMQKMQRRKGLLGITTEEFRESSRQHVLEDGTAIVPAGPDGIVLNRALYWDIKHYLPGLLQVEDRTSMAVSVESRVPFLDHRIVEFAAQIPPHVKLKGLRLKHVEREVARRFLPKEIVDRKDKQGFYPPIPLWFRGELRPMIYDILSSRRFRERGIFDVHLLERHLQDYMSGGRDYSEEIWMVLNVELWARHFIDGCPPHPVRARSLD